MHAAQLIKHRRFSSLGAPYQEFTESDQVFPAGMWRFILEGDVLYARRATAVDWSASENWFSLDKANEKITFGKDVDLGSKSLILTEALAADGDYAAITKFAGVAGETLVPGQTVYRKAADSKWWKTDADAEATAGPVRVAIVLTGGVADETIYLSDDCWIREDDWNWGVDVPLWIDTATAGGMTATAPSATDKIRRMLGYSVTADIIRFRPSNDYVKVV